MPTIQYGNASRGEKEREDADTCSGRLYLLVADNEAGQNRNLQCCHKKIRPKFCLMKLENGACFAIFKKAGSVVRNNMCVLETHSKFEPLSTEEHTLDGLRVHGALIDELLVTRHEMFMTF